MLFSSCYASHFLLRESWAEHHFVCLKLLATSAAGNLGSQRWAASSYLSIHSSRLDYAGCTLFAIGHIPGLCCLVDSVDLV